MYYRHSFLLKSSTERVAAFHRRSAGMAELTPPPIIVQMRRAPESLAEGDEMDFVLWLGPLPIRWLARIEAVSPGGFTDRQMRGPFAKWVHQHRFTPIDEQVTEVSDEIHLHLKRHPFWWFVGMGMRAGLPLLFAYRAWKTRRALS